MAKSTSKVTKSEKTEFGLLPKEWEIVTIGDIFQVKQGKQLSSKESEEGKIKKPFLRTSNLTWGKITTSKIDEMFFTTKEFEKLKLEKDDILVCEGGDIGRTALYSGELKECAYQNHIHRLRPKNEAVDVNYFIYWMNHAINLMGLYVHAANRTTIPNLSGSRLKRFVFPLPPIKEQKKIAQVLSTIQQSKEKTEQSISSLRELKNSLMKHLFTYGPVSLGDMGKIELKKTENGKHPVDWSEQHLDEMGSFQYGFTESANQKEIGPKFLRITDIDLSKSIINWHKVPFCKISDADYQKYSLREGDILIARIGATTGKTCIVTNPPKSVFASYLIRFSTNNTKLDPSYCYHFFNSGQYWDQINSNKEGKLKKGVSLGQLKHFVIPVPALDTQKKIASVLSSVEGKIEKEENKKKALEELFKSMLHDLMTAKTRVKNLELNGESNG